MFRAVRAIAVPGGKGLNVARVVRQLGHPARVVGFLGGTAAGVIREGCDRLGIDQRWIEIGGDSRTCVIAVDPGKPQTVLNEPGPLISAAELAHLRAEIERSAAADDLLCISGSAPPGMPDELYAGIVRSVTERGARVLVDSSGAAFRLAWEAAPWAVSPNLAECVAAFGREVEAAEAARMLGTRTAIALVTQGSRGVVVRDEGGISWFRPPEVEAVNAVGSGDAFNAGFLAGIEDGMSVNDAVRQGVACGASNAARFEPGIGSHDEVERLAARVTIEDCSADAP